MPGQGDHNLRMGFETAQPHVSSRFEDSSDLHLYDLGHHHRQADTAQPHHGVAFVQGLNVSQESFFLRNFLTLKAGGDHLFQQCVLVGHELMQRRVDQADDYGQAGHGFEQAIEIFTLEGQQFVQSGLALGNIITCQDHILDDGQALGFEEHVLGAAKANPLRAVRTGPAGILRVVSVGPYLQTTGWPASGEVPGAFNRGDLICPGEQFQQVDLLFQGGGNGLDLSEERFTRSPIHRNPVTLFNHQVTNLQGAGFQVDTGIRCTHHTGDTKLAGNHRSMRSSPTFGGQDTLGSQHTVDIIRFRERPDHDNVLAFFFGLSFSSIGIEISPADGCTRRSVNPAHQESAVFLGCIFGLRHKLGVKESVHLLRLYLLDGLFLGDQAFFRHLYGNSNRGFCRALAISGLEHPQFAVFNGELDILHLPVVQFQFLANIHKVSIGLREFVDHHGNIFRITDPGYHVLTLGIHQVLTPNFFLSGGGVAGEGYAGTGVIHISKHHGLDIDSGT